MRVREFAKDGRDGHAERIENLPCSGLPVGAVLGRVRKQFGQVHFGLVQTAA